MTLDIFVFASCEILSFKLHLIIWKDSSSSVSNPSVLVPTFVGFLRDIESPYEVKDYVRLYLGDGKEVQEFARQFLERRSKWRSAQRAAPLEDDMCVPAPAVNPLTTDFQEVKVYFFAFDCWLFDDTKKEHFKKIS